MTDNVVAFPHGRIPTKKTKAELLEDKMNEKKRREKEAKRKLMEQENDRVLRRYELGKYDPKKKNKDTNQ